MPISIRNLEWLNHNSQRAYPLAAGTTRTDLSGVFTIPNDFIVELILPVHGGDSVDTSKFYIMKIGAYTTGFSITIGYVRNSVTEVAATALIARDSHVENQHYNLAGVGNFSDSRGYIAIGNLSNIDKQPTGLFLFSHETARLEVDTIRPHIRGVTSLQLQNGSELSVPITGNIRLAAGSNTKLTLEVPEDGDPIIIIDAISGEGLIDDCVCSDIAPPIRTINGIPPDSNGNFQFVGNACLSVNPGTNTLEFVDECSQPCCGCSELEAITRALEAFGDKAATMDNFLVNLEARVTQMDLTVLGSRLGDRSCNSDCS